MRVIRLALMLSASCLIAAPAQTTSTPKAEQPAKESVTVKAIRPTVQVLPDRTVYSLEKNIQSSTSTLSDVLRNLPSVEVDIQGNVSLRGDSSVTILIDGKKSPLLAGNRADALQQIPADMVDKIEVVTNPSAEFRAEGSAGIINIILKKNKEQVASGVARVNLGSEGRLGASLRGNLKLGRVHLNAAYSEARNAQKYGTSMVRSDGTALNTSQDITGKSIWSWRYAMLTGSTEISEHDEIELSSSFNSYSGHGNATEHNIAVVSSSDITRNDLSHWRGNGAYGGLNYRHKFATKGEELSLEASHYSSWNRNNSDYESLVTTTGAGNLWQSRRSNGRGSNSEFKASYVLPLTGGKFKTGYDLENTLDINDNQGRWRDPTMSGWADDSTFTNNFRLERTIHAGYVSFEQKFGRFGVLGGIRLEEDVLHTDLKTTGEVHNTSTLGFYPSVHLSYALTDLQQLKLSYSRRMNRPGSNQLNPTRNSSDVFNVSAGNPLLKPEQVDSFELSWRLTGEKFDLVTTGYYRATYKGITDVYRYLSDTVLLRTPDNLARRMASGVETNLNATLLSGLTLRTSGSLAYDEFNPGNLGVGKKRSGMNWNIRGGLDWQATPDDLFQFNTSYIGKRRFAQGYSEPMVFGDLGYKHLFGGGFSGMVSINNLFDSAKFNNVIDSGALHQVSHFRRTGRMYYIGLVYTFGGARDTEQATAGNEGGGGPPGGQ